MVRAPMKHSFLAPLVLALSVPAVACGSVADPGTPAPTPTTQDPAPVDPTPTTPPVATVDHGAVSTTYPAFKPYMGQLADNGGSILAQPTIVSVTWSADPSAARFEEFGDSIGPSKYWSAVTAEYGVGPASSGAANHVRIDGTPPASMSDTQLEAFVRDHVADAASGWPTQVTDPVYIVYLPRATKLILQGSEACSQGVGGYHQDVAVSGKAVAYAIVPQCQNFDETTLSASHELAEAATDPYPRTRPAYSGFTNDFLAWEFFQQFQSENGDACEFYRDSFVGPGKTDLAFAVQRQWSNDRARLGHDPCVPAPASAYFNTTPLDMESVTVDLSAFGSGRVKTKGYTIAVGETKQIPIGFYSDAAADAWTIQAVEGGIQGTSQPGKVTLSLDTTKGQNGQKAYLTVKVNGQGRTKTELVTIVSKGAAGASHYMPILINSP